MPSPGPRAAVPLPAASASCFALHVVLAEEATHIVGRRTRPQPAASEPVPANGKRPASVALKARRAAHSGRPRALLPAFAARGHRVLRAQRARPRSSPRPASGWPRWATAGRADRVEIGGEKPLEPAPASWPDRRGGSDRSPPASPSNARPAPRPRRPDRRGDCASTPRMGSAYASANRSTNARRPGRLAASSVALAVPYAARRSGRTPSQLPSPGSSHGVGRSPRSSAASVSANSRRAWPTMISCKDAGSIAQPGQLQCLAEGGQQRLGGRERASLALQAAIGGPCDGGIGRSAPGSAPPPPWMPAPGRSPPRKFGELLAAGRPGRAYRRRGCLPPPSAARAAARRPRSAARRVGRSRRARRCCLRAAVAGPGRRQAPSRTRQRRRQRRALLGADQAG